MQLHALTYPARVLLMRSCLEPARADIAWWFTFLRSWNGVSLLPAAEPSQSILSDASGSWRCGATWNGRWFQIPWPPSWVTTSVAPKELVPIVVAIALWGALWTGQRISCYCDNMAVVFSVNKGSARDRQLMRLLRILFFFCAHYRISISARHYRWTAKLISRRTISRLPSSLLLPQPPGLPSAIGRPDRPPRPALQPVSQMDISQLDEAVQFFLGECTLYPCQLRLCSASFPVS